MGASGSGSDSGWAQIRESYELAGLPSPGDEPITAASIVVHTEAAAPVDPAEQRRPYGSVAPLGSGGVSLLTARVGAAVCMLGSQVELSDQRHC